MLTILVEKSLVLLNCFVSLTELLKARTSHKIDTHSLTQSHFSDLNHLAQVMHVMQVMWARHITEVLQEMHSMPFPDLNNYFYHKERGVHPQINIFEPVSRNCGLLQFIYFYRKLRGLYTTKLNQYVFSFLYLKLLTTIIYIVLHEIACQY